MLHLSCKKNCCFSQSKGDDCVALVKAGIDAGFRHIDTAYFYKNEHAVGRAIRAKIEEGVVQRGELFVCTKVGLQSMATLMGNKFLKDFFFQLWNTFHHPDHVALACEKSLENLGLDYIDSYLIHMPFGYKFNGWDEEKMMPLDAEGKVLFSDDDYVDTWRAMEALVDNGKVKSIGVSNFNSEQIGRILKDCRIKPTSNQVECNARVNQKKLIDFCKKLDIVVTAHSPLGRPHLYQKDPENKPKPVLNEPKIIAIGEKYRKSPVQVILRYLVDIGAFPVPKSTNVEHLKQNLEIFDFQLSKDDIKVMDEFNTGKRMVHFKRLVDHEHYPFHIEF